MTCIADGGGADASHCCDTLCQAGGAVLPMYGMQLLEHMCQPWCKQRFEGGKHACVLIVWGAATAGSAGRFADATLCACTACRSLLLAFGYWAGSLIGSCCTAGHHQVRDCTLQLLSVCRMVQVFIARMTIVKTVAPQALCTAALPSSAGTCIC
jgi:hypothetical protein